MQQETVPKLQESMKSEKSKISIKQKESDKSQQSTLRMQEQAKVVMKEEPPMVQDNDFDNDDYSESVSHRTPQKQASP